jgi:hypothetical protein
VAKRSRESIQKRAREKARQEKQAVKRAKRRSSSVKDDVSRAEEDALMEEFAQLSERFEADEISLQGFNEERQRIFEELGLDRE